MRVMPSNLGEPFTSAGLRGLLAVTMICVGTSMSPSALAAGPSAIERAYAKTKKASTAADYTQVIQLCDEAKKGTLTQGEKDYVKRLLAWAFNRRGEARTELAAQAVKRGEKDEAAALDEQALADFEAAVRQDPTRWKAFHNRGVSNALAGNYELAIADFGRVLELNKGYANAWFNLGEIYYEQGQFTEAMRNYNQAIQINEQDAGAYTSRGHTFFRLRQFSDSLKDYNRAVELAPSAETHADRGDVYQSLGQWEEAAADFRRAIELDSKSARAYQSAAWFMATCPSDRYRSPRALAAAKKAVELNSDSDYRYLDTLAAAYANSDQFTEAVANLSRAIDLAPPTEVPALRERLELYQAQKPYRQHQARATNVSVDGRSDS